jgi:hypothetical protein
MDTDAGADLILLLSGSQRLGNGLDFVLHPAYDNFENLPT